MWQILRACSQRFARCSWHLLAHNSFFPFSKSISKCSEKYTIFQKFSNIGLVAQKLKITFFLFFLTLPLAQSVSTCFIRLHRSPQGSWFKYFFSKNFCCSKLCDLLECLSLMFVWLLLRVSDGCDNKLDKIPPDPAVFSLSLNIDKINYFWKRWRQDFQNMIFLSVNSFQSMIHKDC